MNVNNAPDIRLFVTMKQRLYRDALLRELVNQDDIVFVGESSSGSGTLSLLENNIASTLIIEENLEDNDGLTVSEMALLRNPSLTIVLLVDTEVSRNRLAIYLDSGIKAVVSKTQDVQGLSRAINYTRKGQVYIDAAHYRNQSGISTTSIQAQSSSKIKTDRLNIELFYSLSVREREVAKCMAQRISVMSIAEQLGVSNKTIHTYKERIMIKLRCRRLPELILFMQRMQYQHAQDSSIC